MGNIVVNPIPFFSDLDGKPLQNGAVYFGMANTDPVTNPITVYQDDACTIPLQQPVRISSGVPILNGTPTPIYINAEISSILVNDARGKMVISLPSASNPLAIAQSLIGQVPFAVDTISALRSLSKLIYGTVLVRSYRQHGDGGGGLYYFDSSDTTSPDNGGTVIVAADGGRWKIILTRPVTTAQFDTVASAIAYAVSSGAPIEIPDAATVTLNVPVQVSTVEGALNAVRNWHVFGTLLIQVTDGTYHPASTILLNHPYGANCHLIGNNSNPANCVIMGPATPTFDLIVCSEGNTWGTVSGFQLDLPSKPGLSNNWTGLLAVGGAEILNAPNMRVNNWYYGIAARNRSYVDAPGHYVSNGGDVNVWAFDHSFINAQGGTSVGASDVANGWGDGYLAEYGSVVDCSGSTASGCNLAGMASYSNSQMRALGATSNDNIGSGFYSLEGGNIECHNSNATGNTRYGVEEVGPGRIIGNNLNLDGNTLGPVKPVLIFDNSTLGPRLTTNVQSDARFDVVGNGHHYFNGGEGLRFELRPGSSGANRVYVQPGAAGNPATIGADGSDAVIDLQLLPKGAGSYVKIGAGFGSAVTPNGSIGIKINDGSIVFLAAYKP
ncbi:phage tailspike protein [Paraburkholderia caballeronis]|uniref:phage tailspike protein n=1 Tax=Paraburkholderia caballeronis TaxID=416943 RepID=UPI001064CCDD|nr:phage tailspike protein [Paraburkholderia caballeronis]TDV06072.1 head binding protein [Paraburkholderia caballeronis]TDV09612.1 head binding protein [Paraburkholderia caballeronis]TDV21677.1 head binding protein [Paraburkholderia caballeronis]